MPKGRKTSERGPSLSGGSTLANKRQKTTDDKIVHQSPEIPVVAKTAPDDDWQVNKPLSACLGYLREKSHLTDVTFEFPDTDPVARLDAHKLVLAARSPVFEAMFYGLAGKQDEGPITISDASSKIFGEMLQFVYTDDVPMTDTADVISLLRMSHRYRIESLVNTCYSYLEDNLDSDDVLMVLEVAMFLELDVLKQRCLIYIDAHTCQVFFSDHFRSINHGTLLEIVKRNSLTGIGELAIYRACMLWADAQCGLKGIPSTSENRRLVLDTALKQIRFPLLEAGDIADEISGEGVLTDKELLDIFLEITSKYETDGASKPRANYSETRYVTTVIPVKTESMPIVRKETAQVRANQDVFLSSFVWDKLRPRNTDLLLNCVKGKITVDDGQRKTECTDFGLGVKDNNEVTVRLKKSILLRKNLKYIVSIDLSFSNSTIGQFNAFMVPKTLILANGSEVSWSSEHSHSTGIPVNRVLFYPWT